MSHYMDVMDFSIMKLTSQGITFSAIGCSLIVIGFIFKIIINRTADEIRDLKGEIISLRKELEKLKN
jgi:hypothetical protein